MSLMFKIIVISHNQPAKKDLMFTDHIVEQLKKENPMVGEGHVNSNRRNTYKREKLLGANSINKMEAKNDSFKDGQSTT